MEFPDLSGVKAIGISGQMHNVVLWNSESVKNTAVRGMGAWKCSNVITWLDQRVDREFLDALPR